MNILKPSANKLLVTPYRRKGTASGRIILREDQRNVLMGDDHIFWVVAVGDRVKDVKVKDRVLCKLDHEGLDYLTDGTLRAFIGIDQVLLVIDPEFTETQPAS